MEMSRQRLRAGVVAGSTVTCPHCGGAGIVRSVESSALRLLRALEEEGEKNRASAITVKVASDVAIFTLNQKRRELARIEAEYGMDIMFEPKEGLLAGTFDLERTRSRDPGERPRSNAVSIEAGFVPSDEPEDDIPPEEEDEEDIEETSQADDADSDGETVAEASRSDGERQDNDRQDGERGGRRRRRRRGGRGRPRGRDDGRAEGAAPVEAGAAESAEPQDDMQDDAAPSEQATAGAPMGENGEHKRKRRRRRGRRGGRDRDPAAPQTAEAGFVPAADRFGSMPDEIDTTPRDDIAAPGAPSAPVWSLKDDIPDTTPKDEPAKPAKKGWWQRTFSSSE
jgi:ribonuclease E